MKASEQAALMPVDRYARMGNVWFIPSTRLLEIMLHRTGFSDAHTVDTNVTGPEEHSALLSGCSSSHSATIWTRMITPVLSKVTPPRPALFCWQNAHREGAPDI